MQWGRLLYFFKYPTEIVLIFKTGFEGNFCNGQIGADEQGGGCCSKVIAIVYRGFAGPVFEKSIEIAFADSALLRVADDFVTLVPFLY